MLAENDCYFNQPCSFSHHLRVQLSDSRHRTYQVMVSDGYLWMGSIRDSGIEDETGLSLQTGHRLLNRVDILLMITLGELMN